MATMARPVKNRLYGVTHDLSGRPIIREPRTLKVGIGLPKGKALHVCIDRDGKWRVEVGERYSTFATKDEARDFYLKARKSAPKREYPQKRPYFIFTRISSDGLFEPDWDAIEQHGPVPTRIDVVFVDDDPFSCSYQMWSASALQCDGDGLNAMRLNTLAKTEAEQELAAEAQRDGEKMFPIIGACRVHGCPFASGDKPLCKPHGRLLFQLPKAPRLGGSAYYDTTGYRSTSQIFSNIQQYKTVSGEGDPDRGFVAGVPFKLVVQPYTTTHAGKMATQFGVHIELEEKDVFKLKQKLIEEGRRFRSIGRNLLPAAEIETELPQAVQAQMITAEFNEVTAPDSEVAPGGTTEEYAAGYKVDGFTGEILEPPPEESELIDDMEYQAPIENQPIMMPRRKEDGAGIAK
jgi:hypothetical protein